MFELLKGDREERRMDLILLRCMSILIRGFEIEGIDSIEENEQTFKRLCW